jgi:hypothetical protein
MAVLLLIRRLQVRNDAAVDLAILQARENVADGEDQRLFQILICRTWVVSIDCWPRSSALHAGAAAADCIKFGARARSTLNHAA